MKPELNFYSSLKLCCLEHNFKFLVNPIISFWQKGSKVVGNSDFIFLFYQTVVGYDGAGVVVKVGSQVKSSRLGMKYMEISMRTR